MQAGLECVAVSRGDKEQAKIKKTDVCGQEQSCRMQLKNSRSYNECDRITETVEETLCALSRLPSNSSVILG